MCGWIHQQLHFTLFTLLGLLVVSAVTLQGSSVTGTSLGDPIEVGAAAATYGKRSASSPLALYTSKSWIGHAEPAAGIMGVFHGMIAANQSAMLPIMHLRTVNPFVASALGTASSAQFGKGSYSIPRELAGRAATSKERLVSGISSFAFQGTNAHVIVQGAATGASAPSSSSSQVGTILLCQRQVSDDEQDLHLI